MDSRSSPGKLLAFEDAEHRESVALRFRIGPRARHRDVTFGELRQHAAAGAGALLRAGCRRGDRVALLMPHTEELFYSFFSCLFVGLVPCVLAWPTAKMDVEKYRRNVATVVERLNADFLVTDAESVSRLGSALGRTAVLHPGALSPGPAADPQPAREGVLFIQFSGGTTGVQKSVPVTITILLAQLERYTRALRISSSDSVISWLPLYHDMGLVACLLMPFLTRIPLSAFAPMEWVMDPRAFLERVAQDQSTLAWLPNFAFSFMATRIKGELNGLDLSSLRAIVNCSEPVRAESAHLFVRKFASVGLRPDAIQACYAMAETVFAVTQTEVGAPTSRLQVSRHDLSKGRLTPAVENSRCLVSSGTPLAGTEVKIVDENGRDRAPDEVGEILVRAPFVMDGYLDMSEENRALAFADGWYRTGDLGALWKGELFVTGRKKDVIIVGGVNVFPEDAEAATNGVEGVHAGRCAAFGVEDAELGTDRLVIVAEVHEAKDLALSDAIEPAIRAAVLAEVGIAPHKVFLVPPHWIVKSTAGKISRSETRARLLDHWQQLTKDGSGIPLPSA